MEFDVPAPVTPLDPTTIPAPLSTYPDQAAANRGKYLATQAGLCLECHSKKEMTGAVAIKPENFFIGGERFDLGLPTVPVSKNLTSDMETGLGSWALNDIVRVLKEGKDKDGKGICPPMPVGPMGAFGGLTMQDTSDIAHYIKSLPPKRNMVADMCTWPPMGMGM
jgi:hypothetical protein